MSDLQSQSFNAYVRRCGLIFAAVLCGTLLMVGASHLSPMPTRTSIVLVLAVACVNAFLVAAYLMHLLSEKKMIFALLAFTALFFVALMGLSVWSAYDLPESLAH